MRVRKVALLGASGLVAQRFQQRLANHPWFELVAVYGSPRTTGKALA
ncbi:MAG TPA: aspartate-semialdehyde dehydrogenase, partial [Candidatus Poseidoniales archaeon]